MTSINAATVDCVELNWSKLLEGKTYDKPTTRKKGANKLASLLKGSVFGSVSRSKEEILELIASSEVTEDPEKMFQNLYNGKCMVSVVPDWEMYTRIKSFGIRDACGTEKERRYKVVKFSDCVDPVWYDIFGDNFF